MNMVSVKINGVEYNLKGEESEEYLHRVAIYVDKKLKGILDNNSKLSTSSAAVLTAINASDDMMKNEKIYKDATEKLQEKKLQEKKLLEETESLRRQLIQSENYNDELNKKLKNDKKEVLLKKYEEENEKIRKELYFMQEAADKAIKENKKIKEDNKEFKFQAQTLKYKLIDLQNKFMENQIELAKAKKISKNPLLCSKHI